MQWDFARLLISAFAAAEKTEIVLPAGKEAETAAAIVRQLTGRVNFRINDLCSLFPPKKLPARPNFRLFAEDEKIFTFTAGLCVPVCGCVTDEKPPFARSFDVSAWRKKTAGLAEIGRMPHTIAAAAAEHPAVYTLTPESDAAFFAGVMTGALLSARDTDFVFSMCTPEEALGDFPALFTASGGVLLPLVDGVRVAGKAQRLRL